MGKKRYMTPVEDVDISTVKYKPETIKAPHLTGLALKAFVWLVESPVFGPFVMSFMKKMNKIPEMMQDTVIPEHPMFRPEFPPQEPEAGVILLDEECSSVAHVGSATECLPQYNPSRHLNDDLSCSFLYWTIRDYAHAYRSGYTTPSVVAEHIISAVEDSEKRKPPMSLMISYSVGGIRRQATASTRRFEEGEPLSVLDGIFIAIKDDIDLYPHPTRGGTTWFDMVRPIEEDAVSVSRLRRCGVIFIGKANMHEMGLGTTGNNSNYGTTRNPHDVTRYTGGSSSGPAALVASGLCSAALGTDGGGSIRIPSSLCGVVGLKTTYGRVDISGALCDSGTVEIIGPIASSVEDVMLVYAAISGASPADKISLHPSPPCLPKLSSPENLDILRSMKLGKYTDWFNDVYSSNISSQCENVLKRLTETRGSEVIEIILPELQEMRNAHILAIGSESLSSLNPHCQDGRISDFTYDTRASLSIFRSFTAAEYVAAQCLRRRIMHYYMEAFKKVDVIVTPTTGMTAPIIPPSSLKNGESNLEVSAISVPVGYDKDGLPIGIQLIGRPWGEATVLRLASALEELSVGSLKRPAVFYDILKDAK